MNQNEKSRHFAAADFRPAALGTKARLVRNFIFGIFTLNALFDFFVLPQLVSDLQEIPIGIIAGCFSIIALAGVVLLFRLCGLRNYRLGAGELVVETKVSKTRFSLENLESAEFFPEAFNGVHRPAVRKKTPGTGTMWESKTLGKFQAFVTDPEKSVVLRWPEKTVVVSPRDTQEFIAFVRRNAPHLR